MSRSSFKSPVIEPKTQWLEVILLWVAGISAAMQFAKFSVSFDDLLVHYQAGATSTGAALSAVGLVGLVFGVSAGMIASRVGYLKVLVGALLLGGVLSFIQSTLPSFQLLFVTRMLEGFSQLGVVVAAPTLIAKLSAPQHKSLTMGIWGTFFGIAFAVCGWAGKSILDQYGLQALFLNHGVFITTIGVVLFFILRKNPVLDLVPVTEMQGGFFAQMMKIYRNPRALLPSCVFVFYTCTLVSVLTYVPGLIDDAALQKWMLILLPLVTTCGTFLAGAIAQYLMRPQRVALMAYLGVAVSALVLSFVGDSAVVFCFVVGVLVLFLGMVPGSALAMIPTLARNPSEQAQGYGLLAQFGNLGATVGPPTFATAIAVYGLSGLVVLVLCVCAFGVLFSLLAGRIKAVV
ncbi:MFS transporter [Marinomonas sp. M1K-6]|uniref:MFS transporter n=1 Tax=Marinomonas profundi TaxID=2726122 RepID=A0A847QYF5_9GAMM|nr:MFS transporter [Marinomonas profundi]NLQ17959.1 MFS transporter [Marinomonas profundi]UDV01684.1 MFS transporter [Marinomonas profundi]